ncbi:MAG: hypothetical protein JSW61_13410 [Candidatus Thorarchaeota archaeon]|nr:MAG: hypothetical protein JSW61_13410 [Candidatus Thorarchaeota archaeon]
MIIVIKIGGSLLDDPFNVKVRALARAVSNLGRTGDHTCVLVPGGGPFADIVRNTQAKLDLADETAHWMAVLSQNQYGLILSELLPEANIVESMNQINELQWPGVHILLPYDLVRQTDELPHCWDVTGDSIALWIGILTNADYVVLLKSVDGIFQKGALISEVRADELEVKDEARVLDSHLPNLVGRFLGRIVVMNGGKPSLLEKLVTEGVVEGTKII